MRDQSCTQPIDMISFSPYSVEASQQRQKARERRPTSVQPATGHSSGKRWKSSYVQPVKGKSKSS